MLYSPSIGINLNKVNRFQDQNSEGTIYLIPKIGAFDPATSASVLYNRDAYLPRHGSYALNQWGGGKTGENLAFDKGLANLRLIGGEGKQIPKHNPESIQMSWSNTAGHKAALANSPHFKSFAQYESSPAGMATLVEGPKQLVKDAVEPLYAAYRKDMREAAKGIGIPMATPADEARFSAVTRPLIYGNRAEREQVLQGLVQAYGPDALTEIGGTAAKYRQRFSRAPAEYAELQPQGLTPLTEENWAGAMVAGSKAGVKAGRLLNNLPIEWFDPGTLTADAMKRFQGEFGLARRQPIGQRLQLSAADRDPPKTPAPYLTGLAGAYNPVQKGAQKTQEAVANGPFGWLPEADYIPDKELVSLLDYAWNTPGGEDLTHHLQKYAKLHPDDILSTAEFDTIMGDIQAAYTAMQPKKAGKPNLNIMEDLAKGNWEPEPDPLAALGDFLKAKLGSWWYQADPETVASTLFEFSPGGWKPEIQSLVEKVWPKTGAQITDKLTQKWLNSPAKFPQKAKKPLTSTGDDALDAEVDALAKGLEPAPGTPETDLSPTGIPWKNIAGSFKSHAEDVAGGDWTPGGEIANFVDLFKEAGGKVSKANTKAGTHFWIFEGPNGKEYSASSTEINNDPEHYRLILPTLLPEVAAYMDLNP